MKGRKSTRTAGARRRSPAAVAAAEAKLREAMARHAQGDAGRAETLCREALAIDADSAVAWHLLGLLLGERDALDEAVEALRRAASLAPDDPVCHNNLGNTLRRQGALADAARAYRRALSLRPGYASARFNLGKALQLQERSGEAVAEFRRLLEQAPADAEAWDALGSALLDAGDAEGAVEAHRRALEIAPDSADAHNGLGLAFVDLGRFEEACDCFRRALDLDPRFAKAALNLTRAKRFGDASDPDLATLRRLAGRDDVPAAEVADLRFSLGKALDDLGDHEAAFAEFEAANAARAAREHFDVAAHAAFVDELRRVFDAALFERCADLGSDDRTPILIVGMPRSGTTLVEQILASHPSVHGAGEMGTLSQLAAALPGRLGNRPYPACLERVRRGDLRDLARRYVAELRERGGRAARITDKMPGNFLHLGLAAIALPRASVVHCRRHPLDVVLSVWCHQFTHGHPWSWRLSDIAAFYRQYRVLMEHWRAVLPLPVLDLDYEALTAEPEPRARALLAHCGLDWDERCLRFHETRRAVHTASAWQVRQPINRHGVGRWRAYASHLAAARDALQDLLPPE